MQNAGKPTGKLKKLLVHPITEEERVQWNHLMKAHHYLGLKQLVGESLHYVATHEEQWVGIL